MMKKATEGLQQAHVTENAGDLTKRNKTMKGIGVVGNEMNGKETTVRPAEIATFLRRLLTEATLHLHRRLPRVSEPRQVLLED